MRSGPESSTGPARLARTPEELARAAQAGSSAAFAELVARFEAPLFDFLRMRAGSPTDAEELTQESFVRAWRKLDRYDPRFSFSTWLFTLARRLAVSRFRSRRRLPEGDERLAELGGGTDPARELGEREERANLWALAGRVLDADQRSALWLRYAEELSIAEIARVLGRRESTVRVQLFRARERLARHLRPADESTPGRAPVAPYPAPVSAGRLAGGRS